MSRAWTHHHDVVEATILEAVGPVPGVRVTPTDDGGASVHVSECGERAGDVARLVANLFEAHGFKTRRGVGADVAFVDVHPKDEV